MINTRFQPNSDTCFARTAVLASAIEAALGGFDAQRESQKVIIVFTDGEDPDSDPAEAAHLAVAQGAGAEMRVPLGIAVVSGMLGVTFFGLVFTPIFYWFIMWIGGGKKKPAA